ncbi:MAG TPA: protein kinase [Myxococcaceae bacterium]|nr:protein kinase [Myxococcaceae bacterium]
MVSPPRATPAAPGLGNLVGRWLGEWLLVRLLGQGGMGAVYLSQGSNGQLVAVKVLHPALSRDAALVERFHAEARAASRIGHPSIVGMIDLGHAPPDLHYLVMEHLVGRPLSQVLEEGVIALPRTRELVAQVLAGLAAAHVRGVVHRDLKPDNLFVVKHEGQEQAKILDFGVAKLVGGVGSGQTVAGTLVGTPEYMAPEQVAGEAVDARADLYAMGVIAYRMLTGVLPFRGPTVLAVLMAHQQEVPPAPSTLNPAIPIEVSDVVMRALEKRASDRFASAQDMRQAWLAGFRQRRPSSVSLPALGTPIPRAGTTPSPATPPSPRSGALATTSPAPASRPPPVELFRVRLEAPGGRPVRLSCVQVSSGGLLLQDEGSEWPSRFRTDAQLELSGGAIPVTLEVVGHVTPTQAKAWGTAPGHWMQPVRPTPDVTRFLADFAPGKRPTPVSESQVVADDPAIDRLVRRYVRGRTDDPYGLLEIPSGSTVEAVRRRVREVEAALTAPLSGRLSTRQRGELEKALTDVRSAAQRLLRPASRARLDADRGDLRGVAQAIRAGISVTELAAAREEYLSRNTGAASRSRIHEVTARSWEARGRFEEALEEFERALRADPLNLSLHKAYWPLRRKVFPHLDESAA